LRALRSSRANEVDINIITYGGVVDRDEREVRIARELAKRPGELIITKDNILWSLSPSQELLKFSGPDFKSMTDLEVWEYLREQANL
jgi:hypothetical protein